MTDASHLGADRAPRQGDRLVWDLWEKLGSAPTLFRRIDKREEEKCTNNMKMSHDASNMQTMPLSPSPSHCMALMLGKWCWKIVAAITASAMGGPLMIHTVGKMPSRPCCVSSSAKR